MGLSDFHDEPPVRDLLDKIIGDEDSVPISPPGANFAAVPYYQPMNKATMECYRGPCCHFWPLTCRYGDQILGDKIQLKHVMQCNAHYEETSLNDQQIYHCGLWWPSTFLWVPESFRAVLRPRLRKLWEWVLRNNGYDFSWRHWEDDIFDADRPEQRGDSAPRNKLFEQARARGRKIKTTDDGVEFNG